MVNTEIKIFSSAADLFQYAAHDFYSRCLKNVEQRGKFTVALAGGSTPKNFFKTLVDLYKDSIPWQHIEFFFGDERYVPHDDFESNYHMANEQLFSKLPVNKTHIYPIPTDFENSKEAARVYEQTLRAAFPEDDVPKFDLTYLGLGDDGHTASLMPFNEVVQDYLESDQRLVRAVFLPQTKSYRITLSPIVLNNSRHIIFMVTGNNKATATAKVLEGDFEPLHFPAQLIHGVDQQSTWLLDSEAASHLSHIRTKD